ncbi:serine/threonine protein kinase [Neorhodopirellula pilleata]|uniref:Serine/threonine-protein kinase PrkC n=1 Tax=Neorhodopirellula pilleata TaxID=2714738 RepID=A0A5C6AAQ3_9BACT|nr:serine/threonine-protein kinase [Neorhodopirellula pilleata]TWT96490.1 Serine/threonine-protein kinase PrkC [Neorhodopirellula pilleata]
MKDSAAASEVEHERLDQLLQEYLASCRRGDSPDIELYAQAHPALADEIRELFPVVEFAEHLNADASDHVHFTPTRQAMQLGPFHLTREIGSGGMGVVYEATQPPLNQKFAVKVQKGFSTNSAVSQSRFTREAQAASRLHHPNIVPAKYYGTEASQNYLVMPLIDGVSLDRLIAAKDDVDPRTYLLFEDICTDWQRLAALGAQVASALSYAHSQGMIHRDVKPANLILAQNGNIWVTDFGLAKMRDDKSDLSCTGEMVGTPRYMAPEQLHGVADERSDVYGLGFTLFEIVTRQCPWAGPQNWGATNTILGERRATARGTSRTLEIPDVRELNPAIPDVFAMVIMKAIARNPESRYQSARELELDLNELCYRGNIDRRSSPRSRATLSKHQARSVAVLMGVSFILIAAIWVWRPFPEVAETLPAVPRKPPHNQSLFPPTHCITYAEPGTDLINLVITVNSRSDDAEEYGEGTMYLDSSDLELTWDEIDQIIGLRFVGVEIAPRSEISSARLCFYAERTDLLPTDLVVFGVDNANPISFTPLDYDISRRPRTLHRVKWNPERWTSGELYETPDCREIVQSLVNKTDWKSGNAMAFIIEGKGNRTATAYDGNYHYAPMLKIQYRKPAEKLVGSQGNDPVARRLPQVED